MATKDELQHREDACSDTDALVSLAREALQAPADPDYARHLLRQAELKAQFPAEYVRVAEVFAIDLADTDYAKDLYAQAEEACFEGKEFAEVGHSIAVTLGDREKGNQLLTQAGDEITDVEGIMQLAQLAKAVNPELAEALFAKVEERCGDFADYRKLAKQMAALDPEGARARYAKAERYLADVTATAEYARGAQEIFGDASWAEEILAAAETECQFPREFVALAGGVKDILAQDDKVEALLQQGAEFAMSGEEHLDLARGYWELIKDSTQAAEHYAKALSEISDRAQLLGLAKTLAQDMHDTDLAKKFYAKAEDKTTVAGDFVKLAQAAAADIDDRGYISELYKRVEGKVTGTHDLINLAGAVARDLGDPERVAQIYEKVLAQTDDYGGLNKLLDAITGAGQEPNTPLTRQLLEKLARIAQSTTELIAVRDRAMAALDDQALGSSILLRAEERVTNLDEMRKITQAVRNHAPDDPDWAARVTEKLEKREANQAKYAEFQEREQGCGAARQFLGLADDVMRQLEDVYYARKLLAAAAQQLETETFDFSKYRLLIMAVDRNLGDAEWLTALYDQSMGCCVHFGCIQRVAQSAVEDLSDRALGEALATKYYQEYEAAHKESDFYDTTKLADAIFRDLRDTQWARRLLERAEAIGGDHLDMAYLGVLANRFGDHEQANLYFRRAAELCESAAELVQLCRRLRRYGMDAADMRTLYECGSGRMDTATERLRWAEGIIDLFNDRKWAQRVYDELRDTFIDDTERAVYQASRQHRLERQL